MATTHITDVFLRRLEALLNDLGRDGGMLAPSIYDTAQMLRYGLVAPDARPAVLHWLLDQQHADGGWGPTHQPAARELPTVAALLALHTAHPSDPPIRRACTAGRAWFAAQPRRWSGALPDDIPVGIELLLPPLITQAEAAGLIAPRPLETLAQLGERRRRMVAQYPLHAGGTLSHSWEALGVPPTEQVIDGSGGVGHSPAATAAWLAAATQANLPESVYERAQTYLSRASAATRSGIPGLQPTVWPIDGFERVWVLHALAIAGLLDHPAVEPLVQPHLQALRMAISPGGIGMSPHFINDGDITATALATLQMAGQRVDMHCLEHFVQGDHHYRTYPHELQPSLTTTAHALHARAEAGLDVRGTIRFLIQKQQPDGRWMQDKWHSSWIYTTSVVLLALAATDEMTAHTAGMQALLAAQHADGAWGVSGQPTAAETAYARLALVAGRSAGRRLPGLDAALERSARWLALHAAAASGPDLWIGKELYTPYRVDAAFICAAVLVEHLANDQVERRRTALRKVG